jgi:hypothetical protein
MKVHLDAALLLYREADIAQLLRQCILVNLLQTFAPERIQHGESLTDHPPRPIIQPRAICVFCVHLLLSAFRFLLHDAANE